MQKIYTSYRKSKKREINMWTCLYLSHIVVIIMIIIAILGIIYGISQKKIKVYQVIVIFLFCVISMALVTGVTSMQCIDDLNSDIDSVTETIKTNYWTYDSNDMSIMDSYVEGYTKLVDLKTGNLVAVKDEAVSTGKPVIDLNNKEEADAECQAIDIQDELNVTDDYLITLDSKEFIKATDNIYYITYDYTYTNTEDNSEEKGKVYYIVSSDNQIKTIVMTSINNEEKEAEFEVRVLEIINTMDL